MDNQAAKTTALRWGGFMIGGAITLLAAVVMLDFSLQIAYHAGWLRSAPTMSFENSAVSYLSLVILMTGAALLAFVVLIGRPRRERDTGTWALRDKVLASPIGRNSTMPSRTGEAENQSQPLPRPSLLEP